MSDTLYYYADDGGSRADCDAVYLDADHSDLADADRVRATRHKPDGADVIGGGFGDEPDGDTLTYDEFSDEHWRTRVSIVESGEADHLLDAILEQTGSETVREAAARQV